MTVSAFRIDFRIRRWWRRALVPTTIVGSPQWRLRRCRRTTTAFLPFMWESFQLPWWILIILVVTIWGSWITADMFVHCSSSTWWISCRTTLGKPLLNVAPCLFPQGTSWRPCWYGKDCASRDDSGQSQLNVKSFHKNNEAVDVDLAEWWSLFFSLGAQMRALGLVKCRRLKTL